MILCQATVFSLPLGGPCISPRVTLHLRLPTRRLTTLDKWFRDGTGETPHTLSSRSKGPTRAMNVSHDLPATRPPLKTRVYFLRHASSHCGFRGACKTLGQSRAVARVSPAPVAPTVRFPGT